MGSILKTIGASAAVLCTIVSQPASSTTSLSHGLTTSHMRTVDFTLSPLAYIQFCRRNPAECRTSGRESLISMNDQVMATLQQVNVSVNRSIIPQHGSMDGLLEAWSVMPAAGDCNDYAVSKRHALVRRGFPRSALLLAAAITPRGEAHLVLIARTTKGDLVLDNLRQDVRTWNTTGYRWLKRESASNPSRWERLAQPSSRRGRHAALTEHPGQLEIAQVDLTEAAAPAEGVAVSTRTAIPTQSVSTLPDPTVDRDIASDRATANWTRRLVSAPPLPFPVLAMRHWTHGNFNFGLDVVGAFRSFIIPAKELETGLALSSLRGSLSPRTKAL